MLWKYPYMAREGDGGGAFLPSFLGGERLKTGRKPL